MRKSVQALLSAEMKERLVHGGELWRGKRKVERPIDSKASMHVVLRSSLAKGEWSFLSPRHAPYIRTLVPRMAKRFGVRVYDWANVGNHMHLLVRPRSRDALKQFLMAVSGRIAQRITGARRGRPFGRRFFDNIPYSRIVRWGRAFRKAKDYVLLNTLEGLGLIRRAGGDPRSGAAALPASKETLARGPKKPRRRPFRRARRGPSGEEACTRAAPP